ncbi:MAG: hypothetical protein GXO93_04210 [FCB group bacterium]|nr:hypothetical protein [FCB group bacterium]
MNNENLSNKLNNFQKYIITRPPTPSPKDFPRRYARLAQATKGEIISDDAGSYCLIKTLYPFDYRHGQYRLLDIISSQALSLSAFTPKEENDTLDLSSLLFVDTETTGLGGAGVVPFLVGCGCLVKGGFEIRQYLLPDYSDESSLLEGFMAELNQDISLVTYNGAAFDIPLLRDRVIINRVAKNLDYRYHLDLLHPVRRLFKRRLKDCSLINIEKELFDFRRLHDIPGYLVPSVYFEWLSAENLDLMPSVLEHNRGDIISLFFTINYVANIFSHGDKVLEYVDDLHSLSRIYNKRKKLKQVEQIFEHIKNLDKSLSDDIIFFHALNYKRIKAYDKALPMWEKLSFHNSQEGYQANVELAKYYEHREKNIERAYRYAQKAAHYPLSGGYQKEQLAHRLKRLSGKLKS